MKHMVVFVLEHFWDAFLVNFDACFPNHALD